MVAGMNSKMGTRIGAAVLVFSLVCPLTFVPALADQLTSRDVTQQLYRASPDQPLDFSGKDLEGLDLAGLDFKKSRLGATNLFGADLSRSKLIGVDLKRARLDRANLMWADLSDADLTDASILRPTTTATLGIPDVRQTPRFARANLTGAILFGQFTGGDFRNAKLIGAQLAPMNETGFIEHLWRTDLTGANLSGADLEGADLTYVSLQFANLRGANLKGAILQRADLTGADLTGANITNADLRSAHWKEARMDEAIGLDTTKRGRLPPGSRRGTEVLHGGGR